MVTPRKEHKMVKKINILNECLLYVEKKRFIINITIISLST
jgi:hypothetical protein